MTLAMVKVLPEPVTPSRTWCFSPAARPSIEFVDGAGLVALGLVGGDQLKVHGGIIREERRLGEDRDQRSEIRDQRLVIGRREMAAFKQRRKR